MSQTLSEDIPHFVNCMGDFGANKELSFSLEDVLGWCEIERENNRDRFMGHFNQLDAKDLSLAAWVICQNHVDANLRSPSTANHPWLYHQAWDHGEWRYTIQSYVDSQNGFGATIRTNYRCKIRYNGDGDGDVPYSASWILENLSFLE